MIKVPQRSLFSKYGWPAEDDIKEALTKLKAEMAGEVDAES